MFARGIGKTGTETICVNVRVNDKVSFAQLEIRGATGFDAGHDFVTQANSTGWGNFCPYVKGSFIYTIRASSQNFVVTILSGSVVTSIFGGFLDQPDSPSQWPYPLCIGANTTHDNVSYSTTGSTIQSFFDQRHHDNATYTSSITWVRDTGWQIENGSIEQGSAKIHPFNFVARNQYLGDINGNTLTMPATLLRTDQTEAPMEYVGVFEGVYQISSFNPNGDAYTVDDIIWSGSNAYTVIHDTYRVATLAGILLDGDA